MERETSFSQELEGLLKETGRERLEIIIPQEEFVTVSNPCHCTITPRTIALRSLKDGQPSLYTSVWLLLSKGATATFFMYPEDKDKEVVWEKARPETYQLILNLAQRAVSSFLKDELLQPSPTT